MYVAGDELKAWAPNRNKIANLLEALAAVSHLPETIAQPTWIDGREHGVIVACANGLLDVDRRHQLDHDPRFFHVTSVPFGYEPGAPAPARWLAFLRDLWGDDHEQVAALQEWFGYVISGRLDLHKMLLLVGPTRGGRAPSRACSGRSWAARTWRGRRSPPWPVTSGLLRCSASRLPWSASTPLSGRF